MRAKLILLALTAIVPLLLTPDTVSATPTPPYVFVNHDTKECAVEIHGDDCQWCEPPDGWQELGIEGEAQCPEGYKRIDYLRLNCVGYKNQFCCAGGQHRGDCEDMIINDSQRLCAFVEDITNCTLPAGWTSRPADIHERAWHCPLNYSWIDPVACLAETPVPETTLTPTPKPSGETNWRGCWGPAAMVTVLSMIAGLTWPRRKQDLG